LAAPSEQNRELSYTGELLRKLTHLFAFIIPGAYIFLQLSRSLVLSIMIPIALCMIIIDIARLRGWKLWDLLKRVIAPIIRESEVSGDFTGATYILTTACLAIALFSRPIAALALAFIIVGDPASALIGRKFGRHRFRSKSLEGSLAFLVAAVLIGLVMPGVPLAVMLIGAVVATVTEAVSFNVDDNATVPLVSGLVMTLLLKLSFIPIG
jgi:dolichol kinase